MAEAGPALRINLIPAGGPHRAYLHAAARGVASVDSDLDTRYRGLRFQMALVLGKDRLFGMQNLTGGAVSRLSFADRDYVNYVYGVPTPYANEIRPGFSSAGGYAGWSLSGSLVHKVSRQWSIGVYGRWDNLDGAVFRNSPLLKEENNLIAGIAVMWTLRESDKRVQIDLEP